MKKIFSAIIAITILLSVLAFAPSGVVADDDLTALSVAEDITEAVVEGEAEGEEEVEPEKIYGPDNTTCTLSRPVINYTGTVQRTLVTVTDFDGNSLVYKRISPLIIQTGAQLRLVSIPLQLFFSVIIMALLTIHIRLSQEVTLSHHLIVL